MDLNTFLEFFHIIIYIVLGGLAIYFRSNEKIKEKATEFITEAESMYADTLKAGGKKNTYVVNKLYDLVPVPLRVIITRRMVATIVDNTFKSVESYANQQLDKTISKITK